MASGPAIGVPDTILLAPDAFTGSYSSREVAEALQRGLERSGQPAEIFPLTDAGAGALSVLDVAGYESRMRRALAVITGAGLLDRRSLVGTLLSDVATRARQTGVPCHAVVGRNRIDQFDLRILDLQMVIEAGPLDEISAAAARIGAELAAQRARGR
jgi:glycerate kinase